jgi:hypothetical protein
MDEPRPSLIEHRFGRSHNRSGRHCHFGPSRRRLDHEGGGLVPRSSQAVLESTELDLRTGLDRHFSAGSLVGRVGLEQRCGRRSGTRLDTCSLRNQYRSAHVVEPAFFHSKKAGLVAGRSPVFVALDRGPYVWGRLVFDIVGLASAALPALGDVRRFSEPQNRPVKPAVRRTSMTN